MCIYIEGNIYMKTSSLPAAIQVTGPGEVIAAANTSTRRGRRRTYIRGVLSSVSEFISVPIPWMYLA